MYVSASNWPLSSNTLAGVSDSGTPTIPKLHGIWLVQCNTVKEVRENRTQKNERREEK